MRRNLYIFIATLALIATLLAIWNFLLKPAKVVKVEPAPGAQKEIPRFPSPLSSPSPPSSPTLPSLPQKIKEDIIDNLPYETEGYSIQYLPNTDRFFILIKQNPYHQYKNQAVAWFKKFGIENPEEDLPLFFTSTRWIAPE